MKRLTAVFLILFMLPAAAFTLSACNNKNDSEMGLATEESLKENEEQNEEQEESKDKEAEESDAADVVKSFEPDAKDTIGNDLPMQIESVQLYRDGTVVLTPTDDLKKNELGGSEATSLMPFSDSGDVKVADLFICRIGNGGYRTIVALMDDGTISAVNPTALIEDHILAVKDRIGGRDSFTGVVQDEGTDAFSIIGKTEEGDDVILDPVILEESTEPQPAD